MGRGIFDLANRRPNNVTRKWVTVGGSLGFWARSLGGLLVALWVVGRLLFGWPGGNLLRLEL